MRCFSSTFEVGLVELGQEGVDGVVEFRTVVERAGDDQRRARLVDQDRVDFVDDGKEVAALDHVANEPVLHVVAQIVEAVFVVGAVGDVAGVGILALGIVEAMDDDAGGHAEEAVDLAHPLGVALGEVIVDGDDVDTLAGERVEIDRERRHQRLAFAGLHLGDVAFMQNHAADQLDVEMALAEGALGRLTHGGEGRNQELVERFAVRDLLAELGGAGLQRVVRKCCDLRLKRVDGVDAGLISLHPPVVGGAEKLAGERADHANPAFVVTCGVATCGRYLRCAVTCPPGCLSTHRDISRQTPPPRGYPPNEWELSNPRFNGKKRSKISVIAVNRFRQRYGWLRALSTWSARWLSKFAARVPRGL